MAESPINSVYHFVAEYSFHLGELKPRIVIRIHETEMRLFEFSQSHYLKTPNEGAPYMTSVTYGNSIEEAFENAKRTFTMFYTVAVNKHQPEDSWLVPNKHFF